MHAISSTVTSEPGGQPVVRIIRRGLSLCVHLVTGGLVALLASLSRLIGREPTWLPRATRWWYQGLCHWLELRVLVQGQPEPGVLLVANHVSWLDIPVLGAQADLSFVSKSEVRRWPLIGALAALLGTIFLDRGAHRARACVGQIEERLARGQSVALFPEGTTTNGRILLPFFSRLFAAAQHPGMRVQPVALRYFDRGKPCAIAPFVGDDDLVAHLFRILRHPELVVEVDFLEPLAVRDRDRKSLATACRSAIARQLDLAGRPTGNEDESDDGR